MDIRTTANRQQLSPSVVARWRSLRHAVVATALLNCAWTASSAGAADSLSSFTSLTSLKTDVDLPTESAGAAASVHRDLRPALGYPTLHLKDNAGNGADTPTPTSAMPVAPTRVSSAFAEAVAQTLGSPLPEFAAEYFDGGVAAYQPVNQINVPADFVLGPGDELHIQAWGSIEIDARFTIDRRGVITLPKVGEIAVTGIRFGDLEELLRQSLNRAYHGFELSVTVGRLKSIQIYVAGYARQPGSHTVSSLATLINAVFLTGGPTSAGDLRRLQLLRAGNLVAELDLYEFLLNGHGNQDLRLQPADLLYVPATAGQTAIAGTVNQPGIFQYRDGDTVADLIDFAGGLAASHGNRVLLERYSDQGSRIVQQLPLDAQQLKEPLRDGDLLIVQPASPEFENAVTLRGHVAQPLRHPWAPGMTVTDLLPGPEALISPIYWQQRNASEPLAELMAPGRRVDLATDFPDINWDYAAIERIDRNTASSVLLPFHLGKALLERDPAHDLALQPGDVITVFALGDFKTPINRTRRLVRIEGEVGRAGVYPVTPEQTLHDLLEMAGGMTTNAYLTGLELSRASVREQQKRRMHEAIDRLDEDYQRHLIDRSRNVLSGDLSLAIRPEADAIFGLMSRLRAAEPTGRIVIELERLSTDNLPALALHNEDRIYIPPLPETVEVVGAVLQIGSTLHDPDRTLQDYLANAGLLPTADKNEIYLVRPNGAFHKAERTQRLLPGDTIVVPEKVDRQAAVRRLKDWTQVLYQFGLGAAGLAILRDI